MKLRAALALLSFLSPSLTQEVPITDVFVSNHGYSCFRIPALLFEAPSTLYAFAEGRKLSCADHGWNDLVMSTSRDGGKTWSSLSVVHSESNSSHSVTIGNPAPVLLGPGIIFMPFCRENLEVGFLSSMDGGLHWSGPAPLPDSVLPSDLQWMCVPLSPVSTPSI